MVMGLSGLVAHSQNRLDPAPELPDNTLISQVQFSTRILNGLAAAGLETVGEVREASDEMLMR
jgi:DNA-directed RNA polymerase alpha subunit